MLAGAIYGALKIQLAKSYHVDRALQKAFLEKYCESATIMTICFFNLLAISPTMDLCLAESPADCYLRTLFCLIAGVCPDADSGKNSQDLEAAYASEHPVRMMGIHDRSKQSR